MEDELMAMIAHGLGGCLAVAGAMTDKTKTRKENQK